MRDTPQAGSFLETMRREMESWKNQLFQTVQDFQQQMVLQKQQAPQTYPNHIVMSPQPYTTNQNQSQVISQCLPQMIH